MKVLIHTAMAALMILLSATIVPGPLNLLISDFRGVPSSSYHSGTSSVHSIRPHFLLNASDPSISAGGWSRSIEHNRGQPHVNLGAVANIFQGRRSQSELYSASESNTNARWSQTPVLDGP